MLESNLSIIASVSTILVSIVSIFLKQHSNNNNQKSKETIITLIMNKVLHITKIIPIVILII